MRPRAAQEALEGLAGVGAAVVHAEGRRDARGPDRLAHGEQVVACVLVGDVEPFKPRKGSNCAQRRRLFPILLFVCLIF